MAEEKKEPTAKELVEQGKCPECREDLGDRDRAAHASYHWRGTGDGEPKAGSLAAERRDALVGKAD